MSQGIDILEPSSIFIEEFLLDAADAIITTGMATVKIIERQIDGTPYIYDFDDDTFKATAATSKMAVMTHWQIDDNTEDTGIWAYVHTTVDNFTSGNIYITIVEHEDLPRPIIRKFQWGVAANSFNPFGNEVATIYNRLGAWTGIGVNTVLGAFRAIVSKSAPMPSDLSGSLDPVAISMEATAEKLDKIPKVGRTTRYRNVVSGATEDVVQENSPLA